MLAEIYLYRARVGDYTQTNKNAKLAALVGQHAPLAAAAAPTGGDDKADSGGGGTVSQSDSPRPPQQKRQEQQKGKQEQPQKELNSREVFHENLKELQSDLMSSEVKMGQLEQPDRKMHLKMLNNLLYKSRTHHVEKQGSGGAAENTQTTYEPVESDSMALLEDGLFSFLDSAMAEDTKDDGIGE